MLRPLAFALLLGILVASLGCGGEYYDSIDLVQVSCWECPGRGISQLEFHQGSARAAVALDASGRGSVVPPRQTYTTDSMWFSFKGIPLGVVSVTGYTQPLVELHPLAADSSIVGDSVLAGTIEDPSPRPIAWSIRTSGQFGFPFQLDTVLRPDSLGRVWLAVPRVLFHAADLGIHVDVSRTYRGGTRAFPDTVFAGVLVVWPPVDTVWSGPFAIESCFQDSLTSADSRTTCVVPGSGGYGFHRTFSREGTRIREDSGSWDSSTGMARFRERSISAPEKVDSTAFRVLRIPSMGGYWFSADPPLEQVVQWGARAPQWRFFAEPAGK
jgi:hypothetical protein